MTIVITLPDFVPDEARRIEALLQRGDVDLVHIRKPQATEREVAQLIEQIQPVWYDRLVVHDHHALALRYGLHGIHLNGRHPVPPPAWHGALSISCHSLDELARCRQQPFAYMSLSPIFDSISKQGYHSAFTASDIAAARAEGIIDQRVLALGGVTFARLPEVLRMGFGGGMILGDAWK
ncbi:MAG: thiamine phosphate synthase [Bacteroidales bacterium]|nr:thiamine phosphate synthase [Bacteroidales bacterium]